MNSQAPSELLTTEEACEYLNCTRSWIKRALADGVLHPVKLRHLNRFRRSDLDAYVRANYRGGSWS